MSLIFVTVFVLAVLVWINVRIGGSILYPGALFALVWAVALGMLALAGDRFYAVSATTLLLLVLGPVGLTAGAAIAFVPAASAVARPLQADDDARVRAVVRRLLDGLLAVCLVCLPLYLRHVYSLASSLGLDSLLIAARVQSVEISEAAAGTVQSSLNNIVYLAMFTALALALEDDGTRSRRVRTIVAILVAFIYQAATGTLGGPVTLINVLIILFALKAGKIRWKYLVMYPIVVLLTFGTLSLFLRKGLADERLSIRENLAPVWDVFLLYVTGGIVAFDRVVTGAETIPSPWSVWRFFLDFANRFGANYQTPSTHVIYATVADDTVMNVYTMYFGYYYDFGWAGVLLVPFIIGCGAAMLYRNAVAGSRAATLLYSMVGASLAFGIFADGFFLGWNYWLKATLFVTALYAGSHLLVQYRGNSGMPAPAPVR